MPLIYTELVLDVLPFHHQELGVELLSELALPLERQVGWTDNEDALRDAAHGGLWLAE